MDKVGRIKKPTITEAEEQEIKAQAEAAKILLEAPEFEFFRKFLREQKEEVIDAAVNNRTKKIILIREDHHVVHEKWEQEAEDAGKFKFIFKFLNHLAYLINLPVEIEKAREEKRLQVEK